MANIYYIEDDRRHFNAISAFLKSEGYDVIPEEGNWKAELDICLAFLQAQANKDRFSDLEKLLLSYNPSLIIIDVGLGVDAFGDGQDIYKNLILRSEALVNVPVIYLTIIGKRDIQLYKNTRYVSKVYKRLGELDIDSIKKELLSNIKSLTTPPGKKGLLDMFIDSI